MPLWWPQRSSSRRRWWPSAEVTIGPDGTVKVEIDTAVAKAIHPDQDHKYAITAEVVDQSRRTIVGTGDVLVARKPFKVYAWVDRGYYRVGDTIEAHFRARTLDGKPVEGKGELKLLRDQLRQEASRSRRRCAEWAARHQRRGPGRACRSKASQAGQYRLSYKLTDAKGHTIEGGYVFTIIGEGFDGSRLPVQRHRADPRQEGVRSPARRSSCRSTPTGSAATVLLFVRPTNGVYLPPEVIQLKGKSTVERDRRGEAGHAQLLRRGRHRRRRPVHTEIKEIVVPPEKRVLNVEVKPSAEAYKPGEKAKVEVKLTDSTGEPFVGLHRA